MYDYLKNLILIPIYCSCKVISKLPGISFSNLTTNRKCFNQSAWVLEDP